MKKRGNGEGCIYKRKDGRWAAKYTVHTSTGPKRRDVYGKTRKEVAQKLREALDRNPGITQDPVNLEDFLKRWLEDSVKDSVSKSTWERYEQIVRVHIIPSLGRVKLGDLSPLQVQVLYKSKTEEGLSPRSVQYIHVTLHKALKQAMRWGFLTRNVTESVDVPKIKKKEIRPLNPEQVDRLMRGLENDRDRALYALAVTTGMRRGEILGLKWSDVDLETEALQVRRALSLTRKDKTGRGLIFVPPKSAKGKRGIALTPFMVDILKKYQRIRSGKGACEDGLLFPNPQGEPLRPSTISQHFKRLAKRTGLPPTVRFHDLRHTCATLLLSKGIHPKIVQEILGHSTVSITLDTYSHVLPNMQKEAVRAMEGMISKGETDNV